MRSSGHQLHHSNPTTEVKVTARSRFKMKGILGGLFLLLCISTSVSLPLSKNKVLLIEPKTIKYYASYYKSDMTIIDSENTMHFNTGGTTSEELIRVPLAGMGKLDPHSVIRITVAIKPRTTEESDPHIGLTDGVAENRIRISDSAGECYIHSGSRVTADVPRDTTQHYEYILLFEPFQKYGACSHIGGHITPGYFTQRLDVSKGLDFIVKRENTDEDYDFYYFLIEIV